TWLLAPRPQLLQHFGPAAETDHGSPSGQQLRWRDHRALPAVQRIVFRACQLGQFRRSASGFDAQVTLRDPPALIGREQFRQRLPVDDLDVYPVVLPGLPAQSVTPGHRDVLLAEEVHPINLATARDRAQVLLDLGGQVAALESAGKHNPKTTLNGQEA